MIEFIHVAHAAEAAAQAASETKSGGVLEMLGINWKLFIAQLINFGIIIFILWKWVFGPVTQALQNRTKKIEESLAGAEKIKQQVAELEVYRKQQQAESRREYEKVVARAEMAAMDQKTVILNEARVAAEKLVADAERRNAEEKNKMVREIKEEVADMVIEATEKIISEKLDKNRDAQLIKNSLKNIS